MAAVVACVAPSAVMVPEAAAAPASPPLPAEFTLSHYTRVDANQFRPLAYADNGRAFLRAGPWLCAIGPTYRYVGCAGHPATAPPDARGVAISGDQQGPWWVPDWSNYRFVAPSGFRPPPLPVGSGVTIYGTTCLAPRPDTIACRTGGRAFILQPGWHKFYYPAGDTAHSANPAPQYLPPALRQWSQLPAQPAPPK
ncbi:hypothetical protein ACWDTI_02810 [Gordonia sp. NPDC003424]